MECVHIPMVLVQLIMLVRSLCEILKVVGGHAYTDTHLCMAVLYENVTFDELAGAIPFAAALPHYVVCFLLQEFK